MRWDPFEIAQSGTDPQFQRDYREHWQSFARHVPERRDSRGSPSINSGIPVLDRDPFMPAVIGNPYPFHQELRNAGPVVWLSAHGTYGTGRFAEVQAAFRDWEHFTSAAGAGLADIRKPGAWRPGGPTVETDPPPTPWPARRSKT